MTTAIIYKIPLDEASDKTNPLYKKRRTVAKATFFGFLYGISDTGLSRNLKTSAGIDSSTAECKQLQGLAADLLKQSMAQLLQVITENSYIKPILTE
jgi:DNA polymerase I-like protein with 3'-5' exonuclease and polymerase domains